MQRSPARRLVILSAAVAVALSALHARAQHIVVNDQFNDGNLATNTNGVGNGFVAIGMNGATVPVEGTDAFHVDTNAFGDYAAQGVSDKTGFDFWNAGGATVTWTTGNAAVTVDQTGILSQFPGGAQADWRQELGIVSGFRSNTDNVPDELYQNAQGGLYINLYYDRAGSSGPLTVTGALRAVNKNHPVGSDVDSAPGIDTIATFAFSSYDGVSSLVTALTVNNTGFSLHFDHDATFSITPTMGPSIYNSDSRTLVGNFSDLSKATFTTEFANPYGPDAFVWMHGQNLGPGRGSGDVTSLVVNAAQLAETPPPPDTFLNVATSNWYTASDWTGGVPTPVNNAVIDNNGTVTISQTGAQGVFVDVGSDRGLAAPTDDASGRGGTITVASGGDLTAGNCIRIGQAHNATGTLNVNGGTVTVLPGALSDIFIGDNGNGVMNITGGTVTAAQEVFLGLQSGSSGVLNMSGGTLTTAGLNFLVGFSGPNTTLGFPGASGTLNVSGTGTINTHFLFSSFFAGSTSTLTMTGGTINCDGAVVLGRQGTSTFTHSGGNINIPTGNGDFVVADSGTATYNISGSATVTTKNTFVVGAFNGANGTMNMTGGTIAVGTAYFIGRDGGSGAFASGTVNQSGGSITAADIYVASRGTATYALSGTGSLVQSGYGNLFIGRDGGGGASGTGTLLQTGGSVSVANSLYLGDFDSSSGTYTISGGSLAVAGNLNVGAALASNAPPDDSRTGTAGQALDAKGTFRVSGSAANIQVSGNLRANAGDKTRPGTPNESDLAFEIFDSSGTSTINVAQNADLDGAVVDLKLMGSYSPAPGQTFTLIHAAAFGDTGTGTTNGNGSTGTGMTLSPSSAGQFTLAVLSDSTGEALKASAGPMSVPNLRLNRAAIPAGTLRIQSNGTSAGTSKLASLTIGPAGALDLSDNDLVLDYSSTSPQAAIRAYLASGRGPAGDFSGSSGITSSSAHANPSHLTAIGYGEASYILGLSGSATAPFSGQTADATSLLLKYTYYGDANLDGKINPDDYALIDRGFAQYTAGLISAGSATWTNGDFNYDGVVDSNDYLLIDRSFALQSGSLAPSLLAERQIQFGDAYVAQLLASVPEPASLSLLALPAALLSRRRRCHR